MRRHDPRLIGAIACCLGLAAVLPVSAADAPAKPPEQARELADQAYKDNLTRYKNNPDILVLPGLLANRKDKSVTLWGRATGISGDTAIEFFLIPDNSAKDYEALTVTYAKPSDIHTALEFIGLKPGHPVSYAENRYWPKGERVWMTVVFDQRPRPGDAGQSTPQRVKAEQLLWDKRSGKPLPATGMVFCGSYRSPSNDDPKVMIYRADQEPRSIASNYNEPTTVLDLPRRALQGEVYSSQTPNPQFYLEKGQPLTIMLEPEYKDGRVRVHDLTLHVTPGQAGPGVGAIGEDLKSLQLVLDDIGGQRLNSDGATIIHVLAALEKVTAAGQDPCVALQIDNDVTVGAAVQLALVLKAVEAEKGVRIEPPGPGQVYYRAFLPPPQLRQRTQRPVQPWELHLQTQNGKTVATLLRLDEDWSVPNPPKVNETPTSVTDGAAVAKVIADQGQDEPKAIFVYADPGVTYGQVLAFLQPSLPTHKHVYIFTPRELPAERPAPAANPDK